jgi:hypothetical protein
MTVQPNLGGPTPRMGLDGSNHRCEQARGVNQADHAPAQDNRIHDLRSWKCFPSRREFLRANVKVQQLSTMVPGRPVRLLGFGDLSIRLDL